MDHRASGVHVCVRACHGEDLVARRRLEYDPLALKIPANMTRLMVELERIPQPNWLWDAHSHLAIKCFRIHVSETTIN